MVNCAIKNCKSRSNIYVKMNSIPKDVTRRKIWAEKAGLDLEKMNPHSAICEYHFPAEMWEKPRVDGKKKLKCSAVPTLFGEDAVREKAERTKNQKDLDPLVPPAVPPLITEEPVKIITKCKGPTKEVIIIHVDELKNKNIEEKTQDNSNVETITLDDKIDNSSKNLLENSQVELNEIEEHIDHSYQFSNKNNTELTEINSKQSEYIKRLERRLQTSEKIRKTMRKNHTVIQRKYRNQIKLLKDELNMQKNATTGFKKTLNVNQLRMMNGEFKKMPKWGDAALIKAYQLREKCGLSGYRELLKQGYPLPSTRTLCHRKKNLKFTDGVSILKKSLS